MRCRHVWKVDKTETHPSPFEQLSSAGPLAKLTAMSEGLYKKSVIVHRHCVACGTEEVVRV